MAAVDQSEKHAYEIIHTRENSHGSFTLEFLYDEAIVSDLHIIKTCAAVRLPLDTKCQQRNVHRSVERGPTERPPIL